MPGKPSSGYKLDYEKITKTKVTVPIILVIGLVVFGIKFNGITVDYLDDFFITKAVAEEQYEELKEQVQANAQLITGHIRQYELNENARDTRRVSDAIYNLELYISANGENQLTQNRMRDLQAELGRLGRVRACIIRNDPNEECNGII